MPISSDEGLPQKHDISSTFIKGLRVLSTFDDDHPRLTLAEVGQLTGLDRAAVRRLMITLVEFGYVEKTGKHFALLPKTLTLTGSYMRGNAIGTVVQPILNKYSKEMAREISLASVADAEAVYIAKSILTETDISFGFTVGSRLPLLQTAIGRMLLGTREADVMAHLIKTASVHPYTPDSLMDRDAILREIMTARHQGYCVVNNEFEAGVAGLAVAVGPVAEAKTVIGISVPLAEFAQPKLRARSISILQQCANELVRTQTGV